MRQRMRRALVRYPRQPGAGHRVRTVVLVGQRQQAGSGNKGIWWGDSLMENVVQLDLERYFRRIGYTRTAQADLETLCELHARHVDAIPFEALDVLTGTPVNLAINAIEDKLVNRHRGGYCLEQNLLLMQVLRQLGFEVEGLSARVRWMLPAEASPTPRTHVALKVRLDGQSWLVDVGFGGAALPRPLQLESTEPQPSCHEDYRLTPIADTYRLELRRDDRWLTLYDVHDDPQSVADYEMMNWYTSQHPASLFRKELRVARTSPERRYTLRDARYTVSAGDAVLEQRDLDTAGIEAVLADVFGLTPRSEWRPILARVTATGHANTSS